MKKIILIDTNALMAIAELRIDVFRALERVCDFLYEIAILQGTVDELQKIEHEQRGKYKHAAKLVLSILRMKKVRVIPEKGNVDDLLVRHSQQDDIILTQDVALKRRLKKPYMIIRQRKYVVIVG